MAKPLPPLDSASLLPPVAPSLYRYFENAEAHPFDAGASEPSLRNAWWLAECSLAAYAEEAMAAEIFGLGGLRIVDGGVLSGARFGGRCYVLADDEKIILAFRGTQVVKAEHVSNAGALRDQVTKVLRDLSTDAKVRRVPWTGPSGGSVHRGFLDSFNELLPLIQGRLEALRAESSGRRLWLTGHSLGAALATLAADCLDDVQGIHVFGSPQVGDHDFATRMRLRGWRFRHHADAVAWAPSRLLGYQHVGPGLYFDRNGEAQPEPDKTGLLLDWLKGAMSNAADAWSALRDGNLAGLAPEAINDHAPLCYAVLAWNAYEASAIAEGDGPK